MVYCIGVSWVFHAVSIWYVSVSKTCFGVSCFRGVAMFIPGFRILGLCLPSFSGYSPVQSTIIVFTLFLAVSMASRAAVVDLPEPVAPRIRVWVWRSLSLYFWPVGSSRWLSISPKTISPLGVGGLVFRVRGVLTISSGIGFRSVFNASLVYMVAWVLNSTWGSRSSLRFTCFSGVSVWRLNVWLSHANASLRYCLGVAA